MNENENLLENNEIEIDLQRLIGAVWRKLWLIIICAVLGAAIAFGITRYFVTPMYQASSLFYVNNNDVSVGDSSLSISSGDITASKTLVASYIVILRSRTSLEEVIDYAGVNMSATQLRTMLTATSVSGTEIFQVVVKNPDPEMAERLANAIAHVLPERIGSIIEGTSAKVVDTAVRPSAPSSPSYSGNISKGFLVGFVLSALLVALRELFDITIRSEEDIAQACTHPILVSVPDMAAPSRGGKYYYGYGASHKSGSGGPKAIVGGEISFGAAEAYKLLRTKLQFSFADDKNSRIIGISSALSGEGKSLSSVNLAYTLSQLNKRVLLIDCDMRRPSICEKLPVRKMPGLSGYLAGQSRLEEVIQKCGIEKEEDAFDVIASGRNPPNPVELLISEKMEKLLALLRERYDYIILDLPPVGEVSDAMAVANKIDGMLLVVRQNYCNRIALSSAVRQFAFVDARILGMVYNCTVEGGGAYGRGYYKRYYYYRYSKKYENSYMRAARSAKRSKEAAQEEK